MNLFLEFKFFIFILDLSLTILPFHLLGLNGLIGDMDNLFEFKLNMGPWTDKLSLQCFQLEWKQAHHQKLIF